MMSQSRSPSIAGYTTIAPSVLTLLQMICGKQNSPFKVEALLLVCCSLAMDRQLLKA